MAISTRPGKATRQSGTIGNRPAARHGSATIFSLGSRDRAPGWPNSCARLQPGRLGRKRMDQGLDLAPTAADGAVPAAAQAGGEPQTLDPDTLGWDPEYRAALHPLLKGQNGRAEGGE